MKMTDLFLAELEREAVVTRRALERVPEGKYDWKPHPKSMPLGTLARLVASMPSWIPMVVNQDELDLNPPNGKKYEQPELRTRRELVEAHDQNVAGAREARVADVVAQVEVIVVHPDRVADVQRAEADALPVARPTSSRARRRFMM